VERGSQASNAVLKKVGIMNTINPNNLNQTFNGYYNYALDFAIKRASFTDEQIHGGVMIENRNTY